MSGATGKLSLVFRKRDDGVTYMAKQYYKLPLQVLRPHYQDDDGTAFVYMLNPSGGVLQNDISNSYDSRLGDLMWTISKLSFANFGHIDDVIVRELSEAEVTQYSGSTIAVPESSEAGELTSYLEPISLTALKAELDAVN